MIVGHPLRNGGTQEVVEMFTCEGCGTAYRPAEETSVARLYVKDSRCNHVEAHCPHCGIIEVIYLGPNRIQDLLASTGLPVSVFAEASPRLRVRAENAWAAAAEEADLVDPGHHGEPSGTGGDGQPSPARQLDGGTTVTQAPQSYELTPRHEQLLASFGEALGNIPDELLWDGLQGEHHGDLPTRWID
jgi:hypothetical protein